MGLEILSHETEGDRATVTFRASVFEKGRDVSFVECSTFLRRGGIWRYAAAETPADVGTKSS